MAATITLSDKYTATVEEYNGKPTVRVLQDGRRTPGSWFATTIVERGPSAGELFIDFGANWKLDANEAALLFGFAVGVLAAAAIKPEPIHTVRGLPIPAEGLPYGTTHDMDCPACQGTSFTASPRSETYWAS